MRMLLQMLVVGSIIGTIYANFDVIGSSVDVIKKVEVEATANIEIKNIGRSLLYTFIQDEEMPAEEDFSDYLRDNMETAQAGVQRDYAKDIWGTDYRLKIRKRGVRVMSAGPDKAFGTEDDINHYQSFKGYALHDLIGSE